MEDLQIHLIPAERIHADEDFNCRGYISPADVVDLAKDIEQNTLQQPITVQPYNDDQRKLTGRDYRIIQGHRRFTALTVVLHREEIPCMIVTGLTETEALIRNLGENLQRKALNIVQEAKALARLHKSGLTQMQVAQHLRMQRPWVQTRFYVLDFPEDIQEEISKGTLSQAQIHEIHSLPPDQWYPAVRQIKEARIRAGGKRIKISAKNLRKPKAESLLKAKLRNQAEITTLLDHFTDNSEPGFHTRILAWAIGNISTIDVLEDFKKFCDQEGYNYRVPTDGIAGL